MPLFLSWFAFAALFGLAQGPPLSTVPETFNFGTVKQGTKVTHEFAVGNSSTTPLAIKRVEMSMPGMTARFKPDVPPGGKSGVTVQWDTTHVAGEIEGAAMVQFADASRPPVSLLLKGVVRPPLEFLPFPAIFLSVFHGENTERRLQITNTEEQASAISLPPLEGKHFVASLRTIEAGKRYELVARVAPGVAPGHYEEVLPLLTTNPRLGQLTIPVHLFVKSDLYANPELIDFGPISAEKLKHASSQAPFLTQSFLVKHRRGSFAIIHLASEVKGIVVSRTPAHGRSSTYRVDVQLDPQRIAQGPLEGVIEIDTDDREIPHLKVRVTGQVF